MTAFSSRLKEARQTLGFTQKQLADRVGIAETQYQYYEYGKREPPLRYVIKLSETLSISADWLLGLSEDKTIHSPTISPSDEKAATI